MSIYHGHLVKRGFLISPLCGVYGIGLILVVYILRAVKTNPFVLFLCSSVFTTVLELVTGILLDQLFSLRLWNYNERFANFMGFICLRNSIIWGLLALIVVYIIHPSVVKIITSMPVRVKELLCYSCFIFLTLDLIISIYTSLHGIDNIQRFNYIETLTSKVVYFITR
jgi:uncharacterized membrane protein